ncbi:Acg family FMN-binding oxidoreductase [Paenibacillus sp. HW567]|uniref:Acg family FMN-binding oxidoreductase n=1 Tax=Paenibacillus sp. HW567 TaxID=1034769 RepID=UPI00037CFCC8|nr:hypothetical protein [Paenibacillus sp. HW567]
MKGKKRGKKVMLIVVSGIAGLVAVVFAALLLISGVFTQQRYLQPWKPGYSAKMADPRLQLTAHGLLAASGHNMQPWRIKLDPNNDMVFSLYADSSRVSPAVDPDARQFMVSQGTFLEYIRIAGAELGYDAAIKLFPEGEYEESRLAGSMDSKPVARITLTKISAAAGPLYPYLFQPDTNRGGYKPDPLTDSQVQELKGINKDSDMTIEVFQDAGNMQKLADYANQAAKVEAGVDRVMEETAQIFRANEREKNKYRYGFSVEGQGTSGLMRHVLQGAVTLLPSLNKGQAASDQLIQSTEASVDKTPAYALIVSGDNSRTSQVRSGMLYSRLILTAHRLGLAMQPLSQAIEEYPEMNGIYSDIHRSYAPGGGTIQMLVRLGTPLNEVPLSMRRDVQELIISN